MQIEAIFLVLIWIKSWINKIRNFQFYIQDLCLREITIEWFLHTFKGQIWKWSCPEMGFIGYQKLHNF